MEKEIPQISFIIINFQSREFLLRCLASVAKITAISKEIIVVNNDSSSLNFPDINFPIKLIQSPQNIGFGAGVNLGAKSASGQYLFLLNPDAEIISLSVQDALAEFENNPQLAILGAKVLDEKGRVQDWIAGEKITPWRIMKNNLGLNQNRFIAKQKNKLSVDWVSGGAMLVRKDVFQKLGGFDEKFFLYFEDVDLCLRTKKLGYEIAYYPELTVKHLGGKSFSDPKKQKEYYYTSQDYYFQKHFGFFQAKLMSLLRNIFCPSMSLRARRRRINSAKQSQMLNTLN
jgi:GT2 family glycosyltransferase